MNLFGDNMENGYGYRKMYRSITIHKEVFKEMQEIAREIGLNPNRPSQVIRFLIMFYHKHKDKQS